MATVMKPRDPVSLQQALEIDFRRPALLELSLVHRSYLNEAPELEKVAAGAVAVDSKSQLQHVVQARWHEIPKYRLISSVGPDHAKTFTVEVVVHSEVLGRGEGRNKKQAELAAASQALDTLAAAGG